MKERPVHDCYTTAAGNHHCNIETLFEAVMTTMKRLRLLDGHCRDTMAALQLRVHLTDAAAAAGLLPLLAEVVMASV